jgi:molybdopterin-guanine dinucleotide biosynthesis protein B
MQLVSIVGHSGAGKTTLIEQLVRTLARRGLRVATIKHAHHQVELDTPGKDSWRYSEAGAAKSLLVTQGGVQLVARLPSVPTPQALARDFLADAALVLAEGFSHAPGPKIEVLRTACATQPRCTPEDGLIALVTDVADVYPQLPHFALDDIEGLLAFILARDPT